MIVPFPAGGGADILVRLLTKYMGENLGHPFIVQNQPGAGGGLAFGQVARAAPDGQTLGWISTGFPGDGRHAVQSHASSRKATSFTSAM